MKKSLLGAVALGAGGAAGRDLYRSFKKSTGWLILLVVLAGVVFLPFLGMRNLFRGHAPGEWWKGVGDIVLLAIGVTIGVGLVLFVVVLIGIDSMAMAFVTIGTVTLLGAIVGVFVGIIQRPKAQRRYAIESRNEEFLASHGIHETSEAETTHLDAEGNALRLVERTANSIVFMAVGKRNKRAYIGLTNEGEMISYTGVVSLGDARNMDAAA